MTKIDQTSEAPPDLAGDLIKGAKAIARFSGFWNERDVYYLNRTGALTSIFSIGRNLYALRSSLLREIQSIEAAP
jgi:hypothetical protein